MPKSPPTKTTTAEWLLTRLTTPTRAAAILGDLLEISTTRGSLWFWFAYTCTLISLGWRTGGPAFLLALVCARTGFLRVIPLLGHHRPNHLTDAGLFADSHVRLVSVLSMVVAQCLTFALPFVFVRFSLSDRLTRIAFALFLIAMTVYTLRPWVMDLSGILTALTIAAALALPLWRRPLLVLAATSLTAIAIKSACLFALAAIHHKNFVTLHLSAFGNTCCDAIAFATAAIVCTRLHSRLLEQTPSYSGATHA